GGGIFLAAVGRGSECPAVLNGGLALPSLSPAALFTETPHDMTAHAGEDVEMACSFRGSGSPSYSLEIQWWYVRNHRDWTDKQTWASNQVTPPAASRPDAKPTKSSVVKVVGSNISHKLRLSRVKPTDEGTYECRVIDFSDSKAQHHKVKAYLRVEPEESSEACPAAMTHPSLVLVPAADPAKLQSSTLIPAEGLDSPQLGDQLQLPVLCLRASPGGQDPAVHVGRQELPSQGWLGLFGCKLCTG
uniref:V-set and transmembrane domain-containing protein 2-like protein n=1 Tax=Chelonoidis abingdonii TaxID=106734 RepID=A0A8C0ILX9_CHEAB